MRSLRSLTWDDFSSRVRTRVGRRLSQAFTFLVATAWLSLFEDLFYAIAGAESSLVSRLLFAMLFTLLSVVLAIVFEVEDDETTTSLSRY